MPGSLIKNSGVCPLTGRENVFPSVKPAMWLLGIVREATEIILFEICF
jgi:hypothetical protein